MHPKLIGDAKVAVVAVPQTACTRAKYLIVAADWIFMKLMNLRGKTAWVDLRLTKNACPGCFFWTSKAIIHVTNKLSIDIALCYLIHCIHKSIPITNLPCLLYGFNVLAFHQTR
jgi:hypothetical protein